MRVRLTVAYDGSRFHGFAANVGVRTVAGDLADAIGRVLRLEEPVALTCAGRTDKGVHALGQVVTFDLPDGTLPDSTLPSGTLPDGRTTDGGSTDASPAPGATAASGGLHRSSDDSADGATLDRRTALDGLTHRVNRIVGPEIAVRDAQVVPATFDARFSAVSRTYRYVVWNRPEPDPFRAGRAWHVAAPLDIDLLRLACDPFIGEHDFSAFCRAATRADGTPAPLTRRVLQAGWAKGVPGELVFAITASSFCHQMVRSVVGTMVEVDLGRRRAGELTGVIASGDRSRAGRLAPADGLYLLQVGYPLTVS